MFDHTTNNQCGFEKDTRAKHAEHFQTFPIIFDKIVTYSGMRDSILQMQMIIYLIILNIIPMVLTGLIRILMGIYLLMEMRY